MNKKMLIDATHPEETRVVVVNGHKVEEFDFDSSARNLITGNIYLAKVTRVEPSLQAAFVDYGGNRHGFLAFAEIHPDYYQIPVADRAALMAEELARQAEEEAAEDAEEIETQPRESEDHVRPKKSRTVRKPVRNKKSDVTVNDAEATAEVTVPIEASTADEAATTQTNHDDENSDDINFASTDASNDDAPNSTIAQAAHNEEVKGPVIDDAELTETDTADDAEVEKPEPKKRSRVRKTKKATAPNSQEVPASAVLGEAVVASSDGDELDDDVQTAVETEADVKPARKSRTRRRTTNAKSAKKSPLVDPRDNDENLDPIEIDEEIIAETIETNDDDYDDIRPIAKTRPSRPHMRYKIQEVIKPRQIMLVQVIKEERGNKGAALTTYLSLPGRYCVLMPNTARGGGISRKISNVADRKRLRALAKDFNVPQGAGLIIRTAGAKRDSAEISRDYEFLTRQWNQIRELTLASTAPAPIYAESGPIKRAVRDLLTSDTKEILIEGSAAFAEAKEYVELLMPDRVSMVKEYDGKMPLFARYQVESYLGDMFNPTVQLKSGGYLVIGVTEALIAIDVNSGKSTKEGSIEDTALKTNLEAAEEVARQLKLRDLAGLIVIDFIDMDQRRNRAAVESKLKESLKNDRARIQIGRISSFGLLEMSRQRLRTGLVEAITQPCAACLGTGIQRSDDNSALSVLRAIEEEIGRGKCNEINATVSPAVANYLFNEKRDHIQSFMERHNVLVRILADPAQHGANYTLEKVKNNALPAPKAEPITTASVIEAESQSAISDEEEKPKRRRSRGGRGRGRKLNVGSEDGTEADQSDAAETRQAETNSASDDTAPVTLDSGTQTVQEAKGTQSFVADKPQRGRRKKDAANQSTDASASVSKTSSTKTVSSDAEPVAPKPKSKRRTKAEIDAEKAIKAETAEITTDEKPKSPKGKSSKKAKAKVSKDEHVADEKQAAPMTVEATTPSVSSVAMVEEAPTEPVVEAKPVKKKRGWWSL